MSMEVFREGLRKIKDGTICSSNGVFSFHSLADELKGQGAMDSEIAGRLAKFTFDSAGRLKSPDTLEKAATLDGSGRILDAGRKALEDGRRFASGIDERQPKQHSPQEREDFLQMAEERDRLKSLLEVQGMDLDAGAIATKITELDKRIAMRGILSNPRRGIPAGPSGRK